MNGINIYIALGQSTDPIAGARSDEIQTGCDAIEIASASEQQWREFVAGRKEWSVSVDWLLGTGRSLTDLLSVGQSYTLNIVSRSGSSGSAVLSGRAIMTQCRIRATTGNLVQGSFQFKGATALNASSS